MSGVLNILDGINERTGQRCFWTTNAAPPEAHFDAAFLRPVGGAALFVVEEFCFSFGTFAFF